MFLVASRQVLQSQQNISLHASFQCGPDFTLNKLNKHIVNLGHEKKIDQELTGRGTEGLWRDFPLRPRLGVISNAHIPYSTGEKNEKV